MLFEKVLLAALYRMEGHIESTSTLGMRCSLLRGRKDGFGDIWEEMGGKLYFGRRYGKW